VLAARRQMVGASWMKISTLLFARASVPSSMPVKLVTSAPGSSFLAKASPVVPVLTPILAPLA